MSSKPSPEELIQNIKSLKKEASRAKTSIVTLEKTAIKKVASIDSVASNLKSKANGVFEAATETLEQNQKTFEDSAKEKLTDIMQIQKETRSNSDKFDKVYRAAMHKTTGVEARHSKITELAASASTGTAHILRDEVKAQGTLIKIKDTLSNARKDQKNIASINENAEAVNKAINETYQLTLDTTMSGSLIERRNTLEYRTRTWGRAFVGSISAIFIGVIGVTVSIILAGDNADYMRLIVERFLLVSPLVVGAIVTGRYYNHERKLYEEYAFKAASAQTIRGYTLLLNQEFKDVPESREKILEFTIGVMSGIFDRQSIVQTPTIMHFIFGGNLAKFEARIEDKLQDLVNASQKTLVPTTQVNTERAVMVATSEK